MCPCGGRILKREPWRMDTASLTFRELQDLIQSGKDFVLLDVRPDYEYKDGHIEGALNFEFHLGHRSGLEPKRAEALKTLLGPDKDRLIVAYCRNFR